jgi:cyclophilin family peptidyl-prolyl cis-trans isomerase
MRHFIGFAFRATIILASLYAGVSCKNQEQPERLRRFAEAPTAEPAKVAAGQPDSSLNSSERNAEQGTDLDTLPRITHRATVRTSEGVFTVGLYGKDAPRTVENFVKLADRNAYRGVLVHRIAKGFVIQLGDPKTKDKRKRDEWGNGGESAFGEPFEDEIFPETPSVRRAYRRGTVAMANRGANTNTSQFFICLRDTPELRLRYTIFGEITSGMATIDSIAALPIVPQLNETDGRPVKSVVVKAVSVQKIAASVLTTTR